MMTDFTSFYIIQMTLHKKLCKTLKLIAELLKAPLIYKINITVVLQTVHYHKIIMMFPLITHAPDKINQ